ncbi:MAG: hypothetical protein KC467_14670 [Marinomonas atlantica]|nr:hypothetical protein [Marinomonas atlantica]
MKVCKFMSAIAITFAVCVLPVQANETVDGIRDTASKVVDKTREVAGNVADRTREVVGDAADRSKEVGKDVGEQSAKVWNKVKEAGNATAEVARDGVNKAQDYINSNACDNKDKLNCVEE